MKLRTPLLIAAIVALLPVAIGALVVFAMIFRHYDGDTGSCPTQSYEITKGHVIKYLKINNKRTDNVIFEGSARYNDTTGWWTVPFRVNSTWYEAIIDCQGGIEVKMR